jgi:16S rRNA (adenine1518-N6/adenine1519-N6)-dimethyltransferase
MSSPYLFAKKSLGQHFLTNPRVVEKMIQAANMKKGDIVLEIGPGTGTLTKGLLDAGVRVIALEADKRAVIVLQKRFTAAIHSGALTLHHVDVRNSPLASFAPALASYSVIANIPYYLSGMLLRTTLESTRQPTCIVFLVQKEVAARIAKNKYKSEKESLLSLSVKAYGNPRYVATVSRGNFAPPPGVDSAILAIHDISRTRFKTLSESWFFRVLHAGFASRRKQLLGNLTVLAKKELLVETFARLGILPTVRGEDLSIDIWCALAETLSEEKITPPDHSRRRV